MQFIKSQETTFLRGSRGKLTAAPCSEGWHKNEGLKAQPWKKTNKKTNKDGLCAVGDWIPAVCFALTYAKSVCSPAQ